MEEYQTYKLIVGKGSDKLSEKVNVEMEAGFILFGNPSVTSTYLGDDELGNPKLNTLMIQAMVLPYEED